MNTLDSLLPELRSALPASLRGVYLDGYVARRRAPMEMLLNEAVPSRHVQAGMTQAMPIPRLDYSKPPPGYTADGQCRTVAWAAYDRLVPKTRMSTFDDAATAYATAKTKATKGHCDWLVWLAAGKWHAARRSLDSLESAAAADKFTTVDGHGRLFKGSAASAALQLKNMRAGF